MTTPTPGQPLSEADVSLLQPGDWLLHPQWGSARYAPESEDCRFLTGPWTFLGRPDQDGWIAWEGGENPVGDAVVEVKYRNGETEERSAIRFGWTHWEDPDRPKLGVYDIIAYRPHAPVSRPGDGVAGERESVTHDVKCWPDPYDARAAGLKPWELRANDRDYRVGDTLRQRRFDPDTQQFTGEVDERPITWALYGPAFGLPAGQVIMTLGDDALTPPAEPVSRPAGEGEREAVARIRKAADEPSKMVGVTLFTDVRVDDLRSVLSLLSPAAPDAGGGGDQRQEAIDDVISHANDWRTAFIAMDAAEETPEDGSGKPGYWLHQIKVLDRIVSALQPGGER